MAASLIAVLVLATSALALEAPQVAEPGARARSMGGAFTAVASDLSAVYWNPAGLAGIGQRTLQAESRIQFGSGAPGQPVDQFAIPDASIPEAADVEQFTVTPGTKVTYFLIGASTPITWQPLAPAGLSAAVTYRRIIDMAYQQGQVFLFDSGETFIPWEFNKERDGGVSAFTLSLAAQPHERLQLGANLNLLDGSIEDSFEYAVTVSGFTAFRDLTTTLHQVQGTSFELGAKVKVIDQLDIGAVYRPGYDIELVDGNFEERIFSGGGGGLPPQDDRFFGPLPDQRWEMPDFFSVGMALRPADNWLLAADYQHRPWDEVNFFQSVGGRDVELDEQLYATHSVHVGGEYTVQIGRVGMPIRAGYHSAPTVFANVDSLSADVDEDGFRTFRGDRIEGHTISLGVGIHFETVHFDIGYDRTNLTTVEFQLGNRFFVERPIYLVQLDETFHNLYFTSTLYY
jgi:long-subunit fatty acid transport protein